jgi:GDP-4-dehydro-6-deoxy-D-mannose reductase
MTVKTILVTGAEGFLGTHLTQHLRARGYEVVAGVRNRARKLAYERHFGKALVCDVADAINVARVIAGVRPEGIVHLAGTSHAHEASDEPLTAYQSIVTAWANVLDGVRRARFRTRVVMASTCDVYGNAGSDGHPLHEDTSLEPLSTFASLKVAAESIAHTFYRDYHLDVTIARPFHYIGPGQSDRFFFGAIAKELADWDSSTHGNELQLPDLSCQRDILHVRDVAEAYERLLLEGIPNQVYNICSGQAHYVRGIVQMMVQASGRQVTIADLPVDSDQPIPVLCGDGSKLQHQLGWRPSRNVEQAVRELLSSHERQPSTANH